MDITIIPCEISKLDAVGAFYDRVTAHLERTINYPKWTHGVYPSRESARAAISDGTQYICLSCGDIIGAFVLNRDPLGAYERGNFTKQLNLGEYLVIHALAVSPDAGNSGIGRLMVEYCINRAREERAHAIRIDVVPDNTPARRLYEKCGFTYAGEVDLLRGITDIPTFVLYELNLNLE